ncbi:MAG: metal-dependent hydrolase [Eubacteriales bacterium]|nr:metal-dependent hydrolase [Eubacteriales bacterium]
MKSETHVIGGILVAAALKLPMPEAVMLTFGALLPDIDQASSTLGSRCKAVSWLLQHRGVTHSLLFAALCGAIYPYLGLGVLSHILLDMLNRKGVMLFWPFRKTIGIPLLDIKTGGFFEWLLRLVMSAAAIWLIFPKLTETVLLGLL